MARQELRQAWERHAPEWIAWARRPGHDSYWRFHRDAFLPLVPSPGRLTLDLGCGEGRVGRDLVAMGHRVVELDASPVLCRAAAHHPEAAGQVVVGDAAHLPLTTGSATASSHTCHCKTSMTWKQLSPRSLGSWSLGGTWCLPLCIP